MRFRFVKKLTSHGIRLVASVRAWLSYVIIQPDFKQQSSSDVPESKKRGNRKVYRRICIQLGSDGLASPHLIFNVKKCCTLPCRLNRLKLSKELKIQGVKNLRLRLGAHAK